MKMQYAVIVARTTGKNVAEKVFESLVEANAYYQDLIVSTPHKRVLIILTEKRSPDTEDIIDVHYIDGISYNNPAVYSSSNLDHPGQVVPGADASLDAQVSPTA
jgi:hypothetical protein